MLFASIVTRTSDSREQTGGFSLLGPGFPSRHTNKQIRLKLITAVTKYQFLPFCNIETVVRSEKKNYLKLLKEILLKL